MTNLSYLSFSVHLMIQCIFLRVRSPNVQGMDTDRSDDMKYLQTFQTSCWFGFVRESVRLRGDKDVLDIQWSLHFESTQSDRKHVVVRKLRDVYFENLRVMSLMAGEGVRVGSEGGGIKGSGLKSQEPM